jgi:hypothetical protein
MKTNNNKKINTSGKVHVFGVDGISYLSEEDNKTLFKGVDIENIIEAKAVKENIEESFSEFNLSSLVRKYPNSKIMRVSNTKISKLKDDRFRISTKKTKEENFEVIFNHFKNNKKRYQTIAKVIGIALFIASNPTSGFAQTMMDPVATTNLVQASANIYNDVYTISRNLGLAAFTFLNVLRLVGECSRGASAYKITAIIKQTVLLIACVLILPLVPNFLSNNILIYFK